MKRQIIFTVVAVTIILPMSLLAQSTEDCSVPRTELSRDELTSCFGAQVAADQDILAAVAPIWQSFNDAQKGAAVDRYRDGMPADVSIVLDTYPRTSAIMRILHADAITIGQQEFVANMKRDPELEGLEEEVIIRYGVELFDGFLDGTDNSTLNEFVTYAPAFSEYVLTFPVDFRFAEHLQRVVNIFESERNIAESERNIAKSESNIAESESNIAESEVRIAALQRLQNALRGIID